MILAIDIGNTNIVVAAVDENDNILFTERIDTDKETGVKPYRELAEQIFCRHGVGAADFSGGILASSVPDVTERVQQAMEQACGKKILRVAPGVRADVNLGIPDPSELGADLLVGAVAALKTYAVPMIIFDMGTCTTVSVIDRDSRFLGGLIAPGVISAKEGMLGRASHLPDVQAFAPPRVVCGETEEAIQSGLIFGHAAMVDGLIERIREELGYEMTVIATGGLSGVVGPLCKYKVIVDRDMNIRGLVELYRMNCLEKVD